jgi:hypothetical protein
MKNPRPGDIVAVAVGHAGDWSGAGLSSGEIGIQMDEIPWPSHPNIITIARMLELQRQLEALESQGRYCDEMLLALIRHEIDNLSLEYEKAIMFR